MRGHRRFSRIATALCCAGLVALTGCATTERTLSPSPVAPMMTVGYSDASPDYVLAQLFVQVLKSNGITASVERIEATTSENGALNVGPGVTRAVSALHRATLTAVATGVVDVVPAYTGQLLYALNPDADALQATSHTTEEHEGEYNRVFTEMTQALPHEVVPVRPSAASRTTVVAVRQRSSRFEGVTTMSQLARRCEGAQVTLRAVPVETVELSHYAAELHSAYHCRYGSKRIIAGVPAPDDIVVAFDTDPLFLSGEWRILDDDRNIMPDTQVCALMGKVAFTRQRQLILDDLMDKLSTEDIRYFQHVESTQASQLNTVLHQWLREKGYTRVSFG